MRARIRRAGARRSPSPRVRLPADRRCEAMRVRRMSGELTQAPMPSPPVLERAVLIRMALGIVLLVALVGGLGVAFRSPLSALAEAFVTRFGAWGVFVGMMGLDAWALPPLAHEPLLFFAHAGGLGFAEASLIGGTASFLAGPVGYGLGMGFGRVGWMRRQLERTAVARLMRRRGVWVVAIAAVSPIPFSVTTYLAGALRAPFLPFLGACTLRYLKVAFYLGLIVLGWQMG